MGAFLNEPVDLGDLVDPGEIPTLADVDFVPLHPNHLLVSLIGSGIAAAVVLVGGIAGAVLAPMRWIPIAIAGVLLALILLTAVLSVIEVRHIAYRARQHDISFRKGVLTREVETLPYVRVQHVRIARGPIQRWFGLATLSINSAGPDLHIPGLGVEDARRLEAYLTERAGDLSDDPAGDGFSTPADDWATPPSTPSPQHPVAPESAVPGPPAQPPVAAEAPSPGPPVRRSVLPEPPSSGSDPQRPAAPEVADRWSTTQPPASTWNENDPPDGPPPR